MKRAFSMVLFIIAGGALVGVVLFGSGSNEAPQATSVTQQFAPSTPTVTRAALKPTPIPPSWVEKSPILIFLMDNEQFEIRTVRSKFERVTHILVTFYVTPNAVFSETITSGLTAALKRTLPYGDISGVNPEHVIEEKIESALREWMVKNQPELISALRYKKIEVILMTQE